MATWNIEWDKVGERTYETGIDRGVLYPQSGGAYPKGYAWSGLTNVSESPSGAEDTALYADNIKYLNLKSAEEFGLTIECYSYPPEWDACDGSASPAAGIKIGQQSRNTFGLCYRTKKGNDTNGDSYGYKIHLAYGCSATPSERSYGTVNDSPDAISFSYTISTTPVNVSGYKPTALITIDSTEVDADKLASFEEIIYGKVGTPAVYTVLASEPTDFATNYANYYKKVGVAYVALTEAETFAADTYYEMTTPAAGVVDARLPMPDEVIAHFAAA